MPKVRFEPLILQYREDKGKLSPSNVWWIWWVMEKSRGIWLAKWKLQADIEWCKSDTGQAKIFLFYFFSLSTLRCKAQEDGSHRMDLSHTNRPFWKGPIHVYSVRYLKLINKQMNNHWSQWLFAAICFRMHMVKKYCAYIQKSYIYIYLV